MQRAVFPADKARGIVKQGGERHAALLEHRTADKGKTEMSRADDDCAVVLLHAEDLADLGVEVLDVVAVSLLSEPAEAVEILTDLGRGHVHHLRELA